MPASTSSAIVCLFLLVEPVEAPIPEPPTIVEFKRRDEDADGVLTRNEYVKPNIGTKWEEAAKEESVRFDRNRDGRLSLIEFAWTPPGQAEPAIMFRLLDGNRDGTLEHSEFTQRNPPGYDEASRLEFAHFDADGSGGIEQEEYLLRGAAVAGGFVQRFFERDSDDDGRMSREEYVRPNIGGKWEEAAKSEAVQYDMDGDGYFTAAEFARTPPAEASPAMRFALGDADRNGSLDRDELAGLSPQVDHVVIGAWLLRYDQNDDRRISAAEWNREGWEQEPVTDPVADKMETGLAAFRSLLADHDRNADGELDAAEWSNIDLVRVEPGLVKIPHRVWDRDGSGGVGEVEARLLLDVAWGVRRPSGEPYRRSTGHVFNWDSIRKFDKNGDAELSREEFVEVYGAGRERNVVIFDEMDTNHDDVAAFAEMTAAPHFAYDAVWGFSQFDANGDGRIDQAELDATSRPWEKLLTPYLIAAFDDDGDGLLNLYEFRLTPPANPYADWYSPRMDANYDGRLSWEEYYHEESPQFIGLYAEYYRRFDRDRDELLAPQELEFRVDLAKVSPEVAFTVQDKDGDDRITFDEVFTEPKPEDGDARKLQEYQLRLIRAEESFLTGDADGDGAINAAEFRTARRHAAATAVLGPAGTAGTAATNEEDGPNWLMIGFLTLDALVLVGIGFWVFRGSRGRA